MIRQARKRGARLAWQRLCWKTDRINDLGLALPRGTLALDVPISVPTAGVCGERRPGTMTASLRRGALIDGGNDRLCVGPIIRFQYEG